jgi:N-acetylmuramoyl-L-alanine amidase
MILTPTVCLDGGHGGKDSGAVGPNGLQEKHVALNVVLLIGEYLQGLCKVIYTRRSDVFIELHERAAIANRGGADVFVSVHCNSGPPGQGSGFETWTSPGQTASDWLATDVFDCYGEEFPGIGRRMDMADGDVDKEASYAVLRLTKMAATLHELEFIHTESGEAWLRDPQNQRRAAKAIAKAIIKYLKLDTKAVTRPPTPEATADKPEPVPDVPIRTRTPLELEAFAAFDRLKDHTAQGLQIYRTELEAIFHKS